MSEFKDFEAIDGKTIVCIVADSVEKLGKESKRKYWICKLEFQDQQHPDLEGSYAKTTVFQPIEKGTAYPFTFAFQADAKVLVGKRPPSTEEERAERAAAKKKEQEDYEAEMAKSGGGYQQNQATGNTSTATIPVETRTILAQEYGFSAKDILIMEQNKIIPKETPLHQVNFFFRTAQLQGLNPLLKQTYLVPFGFGANKGYAIITAIDSMRAKATATKEYGGLSRVLFDGLTKAEWKEKYGNERKYEIKEIERGGGNNKYKEKEYHLSSGRFPSTASIIATRIVGGVPCKFEAEIDWDEYYPGVSSRGNMWRERPFGQLEKCVEAIALRKAFADALSKMYVAEEREREAAIAEAVDVPHLDWDAILREIGTCETEADLMKHKSSNPTLANDGAYMEALEIRRQEILSNQ